MHGSYTGVTAEMWVGQTVRLEQTLSLKARFAVCGKVLEASAEDLTKVIEDEARTNPVVVLKLPRQTVQDQAPNRDASDNVQPDRELFRFLLEGRSSNEHVRTGHASMERSDRHQEFISNQVQDLSLKDHLLGQLSQACVKESPAVQKFATYLITHIDERGYLTEGVESLTSAFNFGVATSPAELNAAGDLEVKVTVDEAERALVCLQRLEPIGAVARSLQDRLLIQLRYLPIPHPTITDLVVLSDLVENYFDDVIHNRLDKLVVQTGYSISQIKQARHDLRYLDPDPCRSFSSVRPTARVVPEIIVKQRGDHRFDVRLCRDEIPEIRLSTTYRRMVNQPGAASDAVAFVLGKIAQAKQLMEAIEQRYRTLREIVEAAVEYQSEFVKHGVHHLRPLTQDELANQLGKHPATVSRAVSGKWIEVPWGIVQLQQFFATADEIVALQIKSRLAELIEGEDKTCPYTDGQLQEFLKCDGHLAGRTTVAKYRREMATPAAALRRVF